MPLISRLNAIDIRFPTSLELDGSDAMNPDPDYSAAYLVLGSDDGIEATSLVFTIGRGNDVQTAAIAALSEHVVGRPAPRTAAELAQFSRDLVHDSQLRWLGPEKGVMHMAIGAMVNAAWDGAAKAAGLPLWEFLAGLTPEEILEQIDFRYLDDAVTPEQALRLLQRNAATKAERVAELKRSGYPAYTTTPGWLGYSDEKLTRLAKEAVERGFGQIKLKVGDDLDDDIRRLRIARDIVGADIAIATDANQRWGVAEAVRWMSSLAPFDIAWIEEPTSPDDVLGHAAIAEALAPMRVATGEHVQNRVVFKQLLQARAIGVLQIDACRVGGVNELLAILVLAAHFGVPVCPHAGGAGLSEMVQHLAFFDYVGVSASMEGRLLEWADHLHEHFEHPARVHKGRYVAPSGPGLTADMHAASLSAHRYPEGSVWRELEA